MKEKTREQLIAAEEKALEAKKKLRVRPHTIKLNSVQAYEVFNGFGTICGGNAAILVRHGDRSRVDYPKVFPSTRKAQEFIQWDERAVLARDYTEYLARDL